MNDRTRGRAVHALVVHGRAAGISEAEVRFLLSSVDGDPALARNVINLGWRPPAQPEGTPR